MSKQTKQSVELAEVPEITKSEWKVHKVNDRLLSIKSEEYYNYMVAYIEIDPYSQTDVNTSQNNAQAICIAINNTYSKGINPKAVPDLVEALKAITDNIENWLKTGIPANEEQSKSFYDTAIKALKKAELK